MGAIIPFQSFIINFQSALSPSNQPMKKGRDSNTHANRNFTFGKTRQQTKTYGNPLRNNKPSNPPNLKKKNNEKPSNPGTQANQSKTLALIQMYDKKIEGKNFEQLWKQFMECTSHLFSFLLFIPTPLNDQGKKVLQNGKFLKLWLSLLATNPYINHPLVTQNAYNQFKQNMTSNNAQFSQYCLSILSPLKETPIKPTNKPQSIKRSALKTSGKKVQFKADEIIYPPIEGYEPVHLDNIQMKKKERILSLRNKHGYLLDFLEINDIYLVEDIQFVGLIAEIEDRYAIILIKYEGKEIPCIGVLAGNREDQDPYTLQKIQKQYENLSFIDLEGKDLSSLFIKSIQHENQI